MKKLFWLMSLMLFCSCASEVYKTLPKEYTTKERIDKAKGFAEEFFGKCNNKDYSEIQGYDIDVNLKKEFTPEKFEKGCVKISEKLGKVTIGEFNNAMTFTRPADYSDMIVFKAKSEKSDSVKFVVVNLYRDKDFIKGIKLSYTPTPKIHFRIRK